MTTPAPQRFGLPVLLVVGAAALVVGLVIGLSVGVAGSVVVLGLRGGEPAQAAPRSAAVALEEDLEQLQDFVADTRDLEFTRPVRVEVLGPEEFRAALEAGPPASTGLPEHLSSTMASLGLTDSAADFDRALEESGTDYIDGFYDAGTGEIYVKGDEWTPRVELAVVHELVHALQDQHFDLDAMSRAVRAEDESELALLAVIEGDAGWVEEAYTSEQSGDWQEELWSSYDEDWSGSGRWEPVVDALGMLPYDLGWSFVADLQAIGGNEAVNRALRQPPTTLEQVWQSDAWFDGEADVMDVAAVPAPAEPEGARALGQGTLGSHVLAMLGALEDDLYLEAGPLDGWFGDRYVTWSDGAGERVCTAVDVWFDSADDADEALDRLSEWVEDGGTASPSGEAGLSLHRCT